MPTVVNPYQWNEQVVAWDPNAPRQSPWDVTFEQVNPGYISGLLYLDDRVRSGQATPEERQEYEAQAAAARAIPMRDPASLQFGWSNAEAGSWDEGGSDWWQMINGSSPDLGPVMLSIAERIAQGTATPQERHLLEQTRAYDTDWNYRASVPQASDAFNPLGDQFFGALGVLGLGATGGLAAAPLFAGGAGLATTLGSLGTLSGLAGTGAGVLGGATGQDWLSKLGLGLGAAGGVLGGLGGLSSLWGTGVQSLSDAAKLASGVGKITGAVGSASGNDALRQASRYLGQAGQLGQFGSGVLPSSFTDWSGGNSPLAANVAPSVQNLLSAADVATARGGGVMEWDYSNDWGASAPYDNWSWDAGATSPGGFTPDYSYDYGGQQPYDNWSGSGGAGSLSLEDQVRQAIAGRPDLYGSASSPMSGLGSVLGSIGSFLGKNAGLIGPLASTLGSLGAGAIGSNAAGDASRLQANALNRGLDLQTAQWLQQQAQQAPWMEAGRGALGELTWRQAQEQSPAIPGATPAISGANYALPSATPGWTPQTIDANAYRWTPGQGPRAADYRYTPGAVPTLSGQELLANDPGVAFRLGEGRKALESSAAARGGLLSGPTLAALQRQGQELSSQEYGQAWNRASQQAQLREQWQQYATSQGWNQAQAEAAFREQLAQQSSQQGFNQQLAGQQWNVGQQRGYETDLYNRMMEQSKLGYGRDVYQNQTDYERQQQAYQQQIAEMTRQFNQAASLSGLGQTAVSQLGTAGQNNATQMAGLLTQLGGAQAGGALGGANSWMNALQNIGSSVQGGLANQQLLSTLANLNR